jgi:hypothetical protein
MRLLFADSTNRDLTLFPSGNSYVLHLTSPLKNIERVDLVSARVPNTMYNLINGSNVFALNTSNVSMNPGFYSAYTLAQAVSTAITPVTLTYLPQEGHFVFSSTAGFTIKIQSQELATMLGLPVGTYVANLATALDPSYATQYILRSRTLVDFSLNEYVFLDIDELRTPFNMDTGSIQGTSGTISGSNSNRSFAPILMDVGSACIKNFHENKDYRISIEYPEPIRSLQRLTIRWTDKTGALLNFQGWETNAFILRLYQTPDPRPTLPPPEPLEEIQIKRIVEAMTMVPPPPPEKKFKIPWVLIFVLVLGAFIAWKSFFNGSRRIAAGPAPLPPRS